MMAKKIQKAGYLSYPVPASSMLYNDNFEAVFSHKVVTHLAGLGWIGKNCLLITPQYGPRVRLASVLTDAPLETGTMLEQGCGSCTMCVDICPSKALSGAPFSPVESRNVRFDACKCNEYTTNCMEVYGNANCGICVHIYARADNFSGHEIIRLGKIDFFDYTPIGYYCYMIIGNPLCSPYRL